MKKIIAMSLLSLVLGSNQVNASDADSPLQYLAKMTGNATLIDQLKELQSQVKTGYDQLTTLKKQYDTLNEEYQSISGIRDMGSLVNNPVLRKYMPDNYEQILNNGYGAAQTIRNTARVQGIQDVNPGSVSSLANEANGMQAAINRATAEEGYKQASQRFDDIQTLLDKINTAPDQKSILDLQARIQAEQVMQQNEATKLAMLGQLAQAQKDLAQQANKEHAVKSLRVRTVPENW